MSFIQFLTCCYMYSEYNLSQKDLIESSLLVWAVTYDL